MLLSCPRESTNFSFRFVVDWTAAYMKKNLTYILAGILDRLVQQNIF